MGGGTNNDTTKVAFEINATVGVGASFVLLTDTAWDQPLTVLLSLVRYFQLKGRYKYGTTTNRSRQTLPKLTGYELLPTRRVQR